MKTLYHQFFNMTVGSWLLPAIKKAQGLQFPSRLFERKYDAKIGTLFLWVLVAIVVLVVADRWLLFPVVGMIAYAVHIHHFCRRHHITRAKQRAKRAQKGEGK